MPDRLQYTKQSHDYTDHILEENRGWVRVSLRHKESDEELARLSIMYDREIPWGYHYDYQIDAVGEVIAGNIAQQCDSPIETKQRIVLPRTHAHIDHLLRLLAREYNVSVTSEPHYRSISAFALSGLAGPAPRR